MTKVSEFSQDGGPERDAATVVATFDRLRADGQETEALALLDAACVYRLHLEAATIPDVLPAFGATAVAAALRRRDEAFIWEEHATPMTEDSATGTVRQRLDYQLRDRDTGEAYEGTGRRVFLVAGGLITRIEEFHDAPRLAAYVRYCAWLLDRRESDRRRGR